MDSNTGFKKANYFLKGKEFEELKDLIVNMFKDKKFKEDTIEVKRFLYHTQGEMVAKRIKAEIETDSKMIEFFNESFDYAFHDDSIEFKLEYGEYNLSDKSLIIQTDAKAEIVLPKFDAYIGQNTVHEWEIKNAKFILVDKAVSMNDGVKLSVSISKDGEKIDAMTVTEKLMIVSKIDDIYSMLSNVLGRKAGDEIIYPFVPKGQTKNPDNLMCTIKVHAVYDLEEMKLTDDIVKKEFNIPNVKTVQQWKDFVLMNHKLGAIEEYFSGFLRRYSLSILMKNEIILPEPYIGAYFSSIRMAEYSEAIKTYGSMENFYQANGIEEKDFVQKVWNHALVTAAEEALKFEIKDKYIYKRDEKTFKEFEKYIQLSHNRNDFNIQNDPNYERRINKTFEIIETFLVVAKMINPKAFKELYENNIYPYI